MLLETDVNAPRALAEDRTYEWLDRVEAAVERAHAALLGPRRGDLLQFISEMEWACRERSGLATQPAMEPRLEALRERLTLVRSMLRQAAAFEQARVQLETGSVLGYTPRGLEQAL
jgi:hypothetical protein